MTLLLLYNNPDLYETHTVVTVPRPLETEPGVDASDLQGDITVPVDAPIRSKTFRWNSKEKELRKYFEDN